MRLRASQERIKKGLLYNGTNLHFLNVAKVKYWVNFGQTAKYGSPSLASFLFSLQPATAEQMADRGPRSHIPFSAKEMKISSPFCHSLARVPSPFLYRQSNKIINIIYWSNRKRCFPPPSKESGAACCFEQRHFTTLADFLHGFRLSVGSHAQYLALFWIIFDCQQFGPEEIYRSAFKQHF